MARRSAHTFSSKSRLFEAALLVAGLNGVPLLAQPADAQGAITAPAAGVICDQAGPTCYDKQGPSIGLTQTYFGSIAANRLLAELRERPTANDFRLSNGSVCDLRAATCWSDGWDRKQVSVALSNQLFGSANGTGTGGASTQNRAAQCRMTRWFKSLYNGNCELRENRTSKGRLLEVSLQDGNVYSVSKPRGSGYQLSDAKGNSWPVNVNDQGRSVSFTWSDRVLTVTPTAAPSNGNSFGQLLNTLMGP